MLSDGVSGEFRDELAPRPEPHRSGTLNLSFIRWDRPGRWFVITVLRLLVHDFHPRTLTDFTLPSPAPAPVPAPFGTSTRDPGDRNAHPTARRVHSWDAAQLLHCGLGLLPDI